MSNQKFLVVKFKSFGFKVNRNVEFFLKIVLHPHIVIAHKKMDGYTCIGEFRHFAQQQYMTLWNHLPVFIPKIEDVPYYKNLLGITLNIIKEFYNLSLPIQTTIGIGRSKM